MWDHDAGVRVREGWAWGELVFFVCICSVTRCRVDRQTPPFLRSSGHRWVSVRMEGCFRPADHDGRPGHNSLLPSRDHTELIGFSATPQCQTKNMQRLLFAMMASAASAFVPLQTTTNSLVRLQANPIDIYSAAAARNCDFRLFVRAAAIGPIAPPIIELPEARTSKIATRRGLDATAL